MIRFRAQDASLAEFAHGGLVGASFGSSAIEGLSLRVPKLCSSAILQAAGFMVQGLGLRI